MQNTVKRIFTPYRKCRDWIIYGWIGWSLGDVGIGQLMLMTFGAVHMTVGYFFVGGVAHINHFDIKI
jgi:hypothetical protein